MTDNKFIRNFVIIAHIDHGKSTLADRFLEITNTISQKKLTPQYLDGMALEKEHGITIKMHPVQMNYDGFVLNLIDTPGHVDFTYEVSRALAAVDGAIVLGCAVEGVMPQTETVLRQALKELVKPILFINKVDRLIKEVKLTPEAMEEKFVDIISHVNELIENIAPEGYKEKWKVGVGEG